MLQIRYLSFNEISSNVAHEILRSGKFVYKTDVLPYSDTSFAILGKGSDERLFKNENDARMAFNRMIECGIEHGKIFRYYAPFLGSGVCIEEYKNPNEIDLK